MELDRIKAVSWDVDGTLYSIGQMKWRVMRMFLREVAHGRGFAAKNELDALSHYRATVDALRVAGGTLNQTPEQQQERELLLSVEKRWYGPAIQKTGPRRGLKDL